MSDLPLNALRAFEVAARTGSFVQAGAELGVTSAAVSQQVKALEALYGKRLFQRIGNRIMLTDAGRAIYPRLEAALADIAALGAELREDQTRGRLVVSVLPTLDEHWLIPCLRGFDGGVGIEIRVQDDPVVLARDGVDLRVTYGGHSYPDHRVVPLFRDEIVAVAAPDVVQHGLAALPDAAFIHTDWGAAYVTQPSWAAYWRQAGTRVAPDRRAGLVVDQTRMAMAAARAGLGAALVPRRIAGHDIAAGRLVILSDTALPMPWDYVLVYSNATARRKSLLALIDHLTGSPDPIWINIPRGKP
jgi:LysR family glycine cleavage system transcriptional activator